MRDLGKRLDELCDALPFDTSWYLKDLTTGERADRRGEVPVPSASTRKISIMMAALAAVHAGKLSLDQKLTVEARYQDNDSGTFQHLTPGFSITLRDAMVMMIIVSDNTCTGMVADQVGLAEIQRGQKLKTRLPSLLPLGTKVAHKAGTGARGFMDAGIVFKDGRPLFILTAYTDHVPPALPDGTPGFAAAAQLIGRMARLGYDRLG